MMLKLVDVTDEGWCPTAAVDGRNIFYNHNFFANLTVEEVRFVLCHEILHVVFQHIGRRSNRDPEWYNMAADYVINATLILEKIGEMPKKPVIDTTGKETVQRVGLYDARYTKPSIWTSEAVYEDLERRKVKKQQTLDIHLQPGSGKLMPNKAPTISISGMDDLRKEMMERVVQAAAAAAGNLPASLKRLIDEFIEPKINWRDLLKQNIQSCIRDDFTFAKSSRRGGDEIFLPTLTKDETIDIAIAIDMSGSISDIMAKDFLSEVYGIMEEYNSFKISLLTFDTKVYGFKEFTKDTQIDLDTYEPKGGGGTDFMAFWNYWIDNEIQPKKAVIFTDGYPGGTWGPEKYCDTLWIITTEGIAAPFGDWAHYTHNKGII